MAYGKAELAWGVATSLIRAVCLSMTGQDPPLAAFVPNDFLPDELKHKRLTKAEREEREETKRKLHELDKQILAKAMNEGRFRGRVNGTRH